MASSVGVFTPSCSTTAFLSVRDGNSHWPFPHQISSIPSTFPRGILRNLLFQDLRLLFLKVGDKQRQMQLNYADGEIWDRKAEIPRWCLLTQTCSRRIKAVRQEGEGSICTGPSTPS